MDKYTLIPLCFFNSDNITEELSELFDLESSDRVNYIELPQFQAVLIFAIPSGSKSDYRPEVFDLLMTLSSIKDEDKILISFDYNNSFCNIAIAKGDKLLSCNTYRANDYQTILYYLLSCLRDFEIKPTHCSLHIVSLSSIDSKCGTDIKLQAQLSKFFKNVILTTKSRQQK